MPERFFEANRERWSETTEELYRYYLTDMLRFLADECPTIELLRRWLASRPRWGASSRYQAIVAARHYFRWLLGEANSPAEALRLPRRPVCPRRTLKEAEVAALVSACDTSTVKGLRDLAILLVLLDCGLRASELVRLRVQDLDLPARRLVAVTKGAKLQTKVYGTYTAAQVGQWLSARPSVAQAAVPNLFVGLGGHNPGGPMTRGGLREGLYRLGVKAGVGAVSPHVFRRSFAVIAHRAGAASLEVQRWGGWADLRLVERYTLAMDLDPDEFEPHSPVNRVMGIGS